MKHGRLSCAVVFFRLINDRLTSIPHDAGVLFDDPPLGLLNETDEHGHVLALISFRP
jgi:hypothetical protein